MMMHACEACKALADRVAHLEQLFSSIDQRLAVAEWQALKEMSPAYGDELDGE